MSNQWRSRPIRFHKGPLDGTLQVVHRPPPFRFKPRGSRFTAVYGPGWQASYHRTRDWTFRGWFPQTKGGTDG